MIRPESIDPEGSTRYPAPCVCGPIYTYGGAVDPYDFDPGCPIHGEPLAVIHAAQAATLRGLLEMADAREMAYAYGVADATLTPTAEWLALHEPEHPTPAPHTGWGNVVTLAGDGVSIERSPATPEDLAALDVDLSAATPFSLPADSVSPDLMLLVLTGHTGWDGVDALLSDAVHATLAIGREISWNAAHHYLAAALRTADRLAPHD